MAPTFIGTRQRKQNNGSSRSRHRQRAGFADSGKFVAQITYYSIALLVLKLSLSVFGDNDISDALDGTIAFIPKLIDAIVIIVITGLVANAVGNMIRPALIVIGISGIWSARDRFWPDVYDSVSGADTKAPQA